METCLKHFGCFCLVLWFWTNREKPCHHVIKQEGFSKLLNFHPGIGGLEYRRSGANSFVIFSLNREAWNRIGIGGSFSKARNAFLKPNEVSMTHNYASGNQGDQRRRRGRNSIRRRTRLWTIWSWSCPPWSNVRVSEEGAYPMPWTRWLLRCQCDSEDSSDVPGWGQEWWDSWIRGSKLFNELSEQATNRNHWTTADRYRSTSITHAEPVSSGGTAATNSAMEVPFRRHGMPFQARRGEDARL